jgi:hypothetical protein
MVMALTPLSKALLRLSASLVSRMISFDGSLAVYHLAATRMARSFLSFGVSPLSATTYVSCKQARTDAKGLQLPCGGLRHILCTHLVELVGKVVEAFLFTPQHVFESREHAAVLVVDLLVHCGQNHYILDGRMLQEICLMQKHVSVHYKVMIRICAELAVCGTALWVKRASTPVITNIQRRRCWISEFMQ